MEGMTMKTTLGIAVMAVAVAFSFAANAGDVSGQVKEVLIKIETSDGVKWYKLGENMEAVDIKSGDYVTFDYADDTIEEIATTTSSNDENDKQPKATTQQ
jgi:plastocyanin